jgi:hypothetical protein
VERLDDLVGQDDVSVGSDLAAHLGTVRGSVPSMIDEPRVGHSQPLLDLVPSTAIGAREADDVCKRSMQLDDVGRAGTLVQPVDVLGDQSLKQTEVAQPRE